MVVYLSAALLNSNKHKSLFKQTVAGISQIYPKPTFPTDLFHLLSHSHWSDSTRPDLTNSHFLSSTRNTMWRLSWCYAVSHCFHSLFQSSLKSTTSSFALCGPNWPSHTAPRTIKPIPEWQAGPFQVQLSCSFWETDHCSAVQNGPVTNVGQARTFQQ